MVKQAVAQATDLEPIDRLEEKVKLLVAMVTQLRDEQARAVDLTARMTQELDTLRARLAEAEASGTEVITLREERDEIRTRVADMLQQLDSIQ